MSVRQTALFFIFSILLYAKRVDQSKTAAVRIMQLPPHDQ